MIIRYDRPVSHAARLARRLGQLAFLFTLSAVAAHRFSLVSTPFLVASLFLAALLAVAAVLLALIGLARLWQVGAEGGYAALTALLAAILPLALVGAAVYLDRNAPAVADITTDHDRRPEWLVPPGANQSFLPPRDQSAAGIDAEKAAYPALTGRRYEGALDRVYRAVAKVAAAERIRITGESGLENAVVDIEDSALPPSKPAKPASGDAEADAPPGLPNVLETPAVGPVPRERPEADARAEPRGDVVLQGEKRSLVLGLPFDLLIRLHEDAETTSVDLRVASRYGPRDLGFSADIAESFLRALDAELLGIAGD